MTNQPPTVCIRCEAEEHEAQTEALRLRLGLPRCRAEGECSGFALVRTQRRLELRPCGGGAPVWSDLSRRSGAGLLGRAVGRGRPSAGDVVVDATAGLGGDAVALASLGYRVVALERAALVAALLDDGLRRLAVEAPALAGRIDLIVGDGCELLPELAPPDLVLLDPMFPTSGKSARTRKGMQALRELLPRDDGADAAALLTAARAAALRRVIVKRPLRAPPLGGLRPSGSLRGRTVRFDLYPPDPAPGGASEAPGR